MPSTNARQIAGDTLITSRPATHPTSPSQASDSPIRGAVFTSTQSIYSSPVPVSARAAARKPISGRSSNIFSNSSRMTDNTAEEDARAENAQLVQDLKQQVHRAELASDQYQKQLEVLQLRLDEVLKDQTNLEDKAHQKDAELDALQTEAKNFTRLRRELEQAHAAEKAAMLRDRERQIKKEEDLRTIIQRMNESMRQKETRTPIGASPRDPGSPNLGSEQHAPILQHESSQTRDDSNLLLQKDRTIETLRLELAESQIKVAEMELVGNSQMQELEKTLLEAKMTNARLTEDNESFQLLLGEKTLKGNFMNETHSIEGQSGLGTLAEELESVDDSGDNETEAYKKLDGEVKSLRDNNKALTLYIDKIIGRLLQHEGFEHIILDKDEPPIVPEKPVAVEKPLPPAPAAPAATVGSLLQRAKSAVGGQGGRSPSKPNHAIPVQPAIAEQDSTRHENPQTAPSIPLSRAHRRSRSDQAQVDGAAAAVVGQMYRGTPLRVPSGGPMNPGISPAMSPSLSASRAPFFQPVSAAAVARASTSSGPSDPRASSSNSSISSRSGDVNSIDTSSPPRTAYQSGNAIPGAVMKQNQLRPLRLVRQQSVFDGEEEARKAANRGSWMGWFKGSSVEANLEA